MSVCPYCEDLGDCLCDAHVDQIRKRDQEEIDRLTAENAALRARVEGLEPTPRVIQRENGCYAACLASLTGIPLDEVPHPTPDDLTREAWTTHRNTLNRFLRERGWWRARVPADTPPRGLAIAHGDGPRGMGHCCIMRNGLIVMDPHPSGDGLVSVEGYEVLVRCAPLATEARAAAALTEATESGGARAEKMTDDALPCEACGSTHSGRCVVMGEPVQRPAFHPAEGVRP